MKLFFNAGIFIENKISRMMYLGNDVWGSEEYRGSNMPRVVKIL